MTRDETLREVQRCIAEAKGYTDVRPYWRDTDALQGVSSTPTKGPTLIPRWPWDWCAAGELWAEMASGDYIGFSLDHYAEGRAMGINAWQAARYRKDGDHKGFAETPAEAIARCWLAWKGIDTSDLR
jgi:hypothetical protein